jgi:hypothetical protein
MKKTKTFSDRLFKEIEPSFKSFQDPKHQKVLAERMRARLFGEEPPEGYRPIKKESARERYLRDVFYKYLEIQKSLERIKLTQKYISRIPGHVTKLEYLQYHYEYYLNEVYIFNLRINHLLDFLIKKCQKLNLQDEMPKIRNIKRAVNTSMDGYIKVRGQHVHVKHHETSKISQLVSLDLISKNFNFIKSYRDWELRLLRKNIKSEIQKTHTVLKDSLEKDLYKYLGQLVFTKLKKAHRGHGR